MNQECSLGRGRLKCAFSRAHVVSLVSLFQTPQAIKYEGCPYSPMVSTGFTCADIWSSTPNDTMNWFSLESRDSRRSSDLPRRSKSWVDSEFLNLRPKQKQG